MKLDRYSWIIVEIAISMMSIMPISVATLAAPAPPQVATSPAALLTLDFKDTDIRDVLRTIGLQQGVNIVANPEVNGRVTIRLQQVSFQEGMRLLLASYGWRMEKDATGIYRVSQVQETPGLRVQVAGDKVTLEAHGVSLRDTLMELASQTGIGISLGKGLDETLYTQLYAVTVEDA